MNLATIRNEADNAAVAKLASQSPSYYGVHIGFNDKAREGSFVWVNGENSNSFTNWNSGEPNNGWHVEHCTHMYKDNGVWNDIPCGTTFEIPYVCSRG